MMAIEVTGIVDEQGNLSISQTIPASIQGEVRVIILCPELDEALESDPDNEKTEEVKKGLHQAFRQAASGQRIPLSQLWEGIDDE